MFDSEGSRGVNSVFQISQSKSANPEKWQRIKDYLTDLGFAVSESDKGFRLKGGLPEVYRFFTMCTPYMSRKKDTVLGQAARGISQIISVEKVGGGLAGKEDNRDNARRFLNYVFKHTKNKTMVHGLGVTSDVLLKNYPFFTVDSTSWLAVGRFASSQIHSDEMAKVCAKTRRYTENVSAEIPYWLEKGKAMDELWRRRGFISPELDKERFLSQRGKNIPTYKEWKEKRG